MSLEIFACAKEIDGVWCDVDGESSLSELDESLNELRERLALLRAREPKRREKNLYRGRFFGIFERFGKSDFLEKAAI